VRASGVSTPTRAQSGRSQTSENAAGNTGFDEVAVTLEKREIPGTYSDEADVFGPTAVLNLYLPQAPTPDQADSLQYYRAEREPDPEDLTLAETGPDTLVFSGQINGLATDITLLDYQGLTTEPDTLTARIAYTISGVQTTQDLTLTETGPETCIFRIVFSDPTPETLEANIYLPVSPTDEVADSLQYYYGEREPLPDDPILTESEDAPSSLIFTGTFASTSTTITIDPTTFDGLTDEVDSLSASVTHVYQEGAGVVMEWPFNETGPETNTLRASVVAPGLADGQPPVEWARGAGNAECAISRLYVPIGLRARGLPAGADGMKITVEGVAFDLEYAWDGCHYLKGGSLYYLSVRDRSNWLTGKKWKEVLLWDTSDPQKLMWFTVPYEGIEGRLGLKTYRIGTTRIAPLVPDLSVNGDLDLTDPEDGVDNYLPGYLGPQPVLATGTRFSFSEFVPQRMKLILPAGRKEGLTKVVFRIREVSNLPGYCENKKVPEAYGSNEGDDFSFASLEDCRERPATIDQHQSYVDIWCKDFGGRCEVSVDLCVCGRQLPKCFRLRIPRDDDEDGIADIWEREKVQEWNDQYGEHHYEDRPSLAHRFFGRVVHVFYLGIPEEAYTYHWDWAPHERRDPDGPNNADGGYNMPPHKREGDGLDVFQEYRGFILDGGGYDWEGENPHPGGHKRLSPAFKELLVEVDRMLRAKGPENGQNVMFSVEQLRDLMCKVASAYSNQKLVPLCDSTDPYNNQATGAGVRLYYVFDHRAVPWSVPSSETEIKNLMDENRDRQNLWEFVHLMFIDTTDPRYESDAYGLGDWGASVFVGRLYSRWPSPDEPQILLHTTAHELAHLLLAPDIKDPHLMEFLMYHRVLAINYNKAIFCDRTRSCLDFIYRKRRY